MKIDLNTGGSEFKFTGNSQDFVNAINRVMMVTGYVSKADLGRHHMIVAYDKKVFVVGYSNETGCLLRLDGFKAKGDGAFVLSEPERLKMLFKGKKEVEFSFDGNVVHYDAIGSSYKGTFTCGLISIDQVPRVKSLGELHKQSKKDSVDENLLNEMRNGIKLTKINDVHMKKTILCLISFDGKRFRISSMDDFHTAWYETKIKSKSSPFKLALPATMFETVDRFLDKEENFTYDMSPIAFSAVGDNFIVTFPPTQIDDEVYSQVKDYNEKVLEKPIASAVVGKALKDVQDNLKAYFINGDRLSFSFTKKGIINLGISNDLGTSNSEIKAKEFKNKKDITGTLDPRTLADVLSLVPSSVNFKLEFFEGVEADFDDVDFSSFRLTYDIKDAEVGYNVSSVE